MFAAVEAHIVVAAAKSGNSRIGSLSKALLWKLAERSIQVERSPCLLNKIIGFVA
jgi:hypothetical protein